MTEPADPSQPGPAAAGRSRRSNRWRNRLALALLLGAGPALWAETPPLEFAEASLRHWVQPQYPAEAKKTRLEGAVQVEFVVEADGRVTRASVKEATHEQFEAAALQAVAQWVFAPALEEGRPVVSAMRAPIRFTAAQWQQKRTPLYPPPDQMPAPLKLTPAKAVFAPDPEYPPELEEQKIPGEVQLEFTVDETGQVRDPKVQWASHPAFVETSLRAMEKTRFEPARQGPLPKPSVKRYPVVFQSITAKRAEVLEANHLEVLDESPPRVLPQPFVLNTPVYPQARLLAGESGSATAEFTVTDRGEVNAVTITAASQPEFGAALQAAVESWVVQPGVNEAGARVGSKMRVVHAFVPPNSGAIARLVPELRTGGAGIPGAAGLDERLKPLWRGFPVYPAALREEGTTGEAVIEFIIDRGGRVRLPRVKSATREEFGWAAANAISQWVFERPRRRGEPVDVSVSIPVQFTPPAQ
jgi:TonB family protein